MKKSVPKKKRTAASQLVKRVTQLEKDMLDVRGRMGRLGEDLSALRISVKQLDERTLRGERLMMDMQLDQRLMAKEQTHMARTVERIATALHVGHEEAHPPHHDAHPEPPHEPEKKDSV